MLSSINKTQNDTKQGNSGWLSVLKENQNHDGVMKKNQDADVETQKNALQKKASKIPISHEVTHFHALSNVPMNVPPTRYENRCRCHCRWHTIIPGLLFMLIGIIFTILAANEASFKCVGFVCFCAGMVLFCEGTCCPQC